MVLRLMPAGPGRAAYHAAGPTGVWAGRGAARLGLTGTVEGTALGRVLAGRDPVTGELLPEFRSSRRRAGWELVVAAPKSVSLTAALVDPPRRRLVEGAHEAAVEGALDYLETTATFARRHGGTIEGEGLVAARWAHRSSASGDPHLHAHLLVANLVSAGGRWSALYSQPLWWHARAADAVYQLVLRAGMEAAGLRCRWRLGALGAADLEAVPRAAVEAVSTRQAQIRADAGERRSPAAMEVARQRTRPRPRPPGGGWRKRVTEAGFGPLAAAAALGMDVPVPVAGGMDGGRDAGVAGGALLAAVEAELAAQGSRFRPQDILPALAAHAPAGMDLPEARRIAGVVESRALPGGGSTLVLPASQAADRAVAGAARSRQGCGAGFAGGSWAGADGGVPGQIDALVAHLVGSGDGVEVIGPGAAPAGRAPLVGQAAVVDGARQAWQAAGHVVAVVTGSSRAAARWEALTGLVPARRAPATPTVVVVDRADRLSTPELGTLLAEAAVDGAKVVLVWGGSSPARSSPRSEALGQLATALGRLDPPWPAGPSGAVHPPVQLAGPTGTLSAALSGRDSVAHLLDAWETRSRRGPPPLLVAAGAAEVELLNLASRHRLVRLGTLSGPEVTVGGLVVAAGDRILALRGAGVPAGTLGQVREVAPDGSGAQVEWPAGRGRRAGGDGPDLVAVPASTAPGTLGYGYATTPALLRGPHPDLLVLGDPRRVGAGGRPVAGAWLVATISDRAGRHRGPPDRPAWGRLHRLAAELPPAPPACSGGLDLDSALSDLAGQQQDLADRLMASVPPDPTDDLRRLAEDRAWQATLGPPATLGPAAGGGAGAGADRAKEDLSRWRARHAAELRRWRALDQALDGRDDALACLAGAGGAGAEDERSHHPDRQPRRATELDLVGRDAGLSR